MPNQPQNTHITIRFAQKKDAKQLYSFIKALAEYEKMSSQVSATVETLEHTLFTLKQAEVILIEYDQIPVGFALFYYPYSTFLGKAYLFLEDLYIEPNFRNKGLGKACLSFLAAYALEKECERLDWFCLDWNEPSIAFYHKIGAKAHPEWRLFRMDLDALKALANEY